MQISGSPLCTTHVPLEPCHTNSSHLTGSEFWPLSPQLKETAVLCLGSLSLSQSTKWCQAESWYNYRAHLLFFCPYFKDHSLVLSSVQCLKAVISFFFSHFIVAVVGGLLWCQFLCCGWKYNLFALCLFNPDNEQIYIYTMFFRSLILSQME